MPIEAEEEETEEDLVTITENATDADSPVTSELIAPLHNNNPTSITGVEVTDGGAEVGAEDALTRQDAGDMPLISEHPEVDPPNSPLATCPCLLYTSPSPRD